MDNRILNDCPYYLKDFLLYLETIRGRSSRTVEAYYIDLRTFLRFLKIHNCLSPPERPFEEISIGDCSLELIREVTLSTAYEYLNFVSGERANGSKTRARKVSSLRGFFKYLDSKAGLLDYNPFTELDTPAQKKSLPKFLTLEESVALLDNVDGKHSDRDYCILTLFLNCGMRLSELVGINIGDIRDNTVRLLGKGNKERIVYLNDACLIAIEAHLLSRPQSSKEPKALFLSRNGRRISRRRVQQIVEKNLRHSGLGDLGYSAHKLRHTAATLLYQHGNVDIRALKEILGHENLATTEIYTHISSEQLERAANNSPIANIRRKESNT